MATRPKGQPTGWGTTLLVFLAMVAFVWGLERWRRAAAHRAGRAERARLVGLARCLLGPDGTTVMRSPDEARRRLRALAMATPSQAAVTWFDPCVALAQRLARHAVEVDNTTAPTAAQMRLSESTRLLAQLMAREALVWRMRVGDPETDVDPVVEQLVRVASEIELAAGRVGADDVGPGPVAPDPPVAPAGEYLGIVGLEPVPVGMPERFFAGAPLPSVTEVVRGPAGWRAEVLANEPAHAWRTGSAGITRVDALASASEDGLAPLRFLRPGSDPVEARVTPVRDAREGAHVAMEAAAAGRALWLAQWTPWNGTGLARFVPGREATARTVAPPTGPEGEAARAPVVDEHVAVAPAPEGALLAYTRRVDERSTEVHLVLGRDDAGASITPVATVALPGRSPGLEFCAVEGRAPLLFVAGPRQWLVLRAGTDGVRELARRESGGAAFDDRLTVRCTPAGAVAYGRAFPRRSPVIACAPRGDEMSCEAHAPPRVPTVDTLPMFVTRGPNGRERVHAEWPFAVVRAGEALVAAWAAGPVVSVARFEHGRWGNDRVVFDAASRAHGAVVEGMDLYADGVRLTLAVAAPDGLHLFASDDGGAHWH